MTWRLGPTESVIRHERIEGAGVQLHVARAGECAPMILLHAFPENWRSWKHQIRALASADCWCSCSGYVDITNRIGRRSDARIT